jgi:hypothetical protein
MEPEQRALACTGCCAPPRLSALLAAAVLACGMDCVDHADNGGGNLGDPGNGGNHHNESNGRGNAGDPGNGQGHFCNDV